MRAITSEKPQEWADHLSSTNLALNSSVNRITKFSPGFLFLGRPLRLHRRLLINDTLDNLNNSDNQTEETEQYGAEVVRRMEETFKVVNKNIDGHLQYRIKEYKENDSKDYQEGKLVVVFQPNKPTTGIISKLTSAYSLPFRITKRISPVCFELESLGWTREPFKVVRSLSDIKLYRGSDVFEPENGHTQSDYQGIHEYDNLVDENEIDQEPENIIITPDIQNMERIKINRKWMLKDKTTNKIFATSQFKEEQSEIDPADMGDTETEPVDAGETEVEPEEGPSTSKGVSQQTDKCASDKCKQPKNRVQNWVKCSGCLKWYHYECEGIKTHPPEQEDYLCTNCKDILQLERPLRPIWKP